MRNIDYEYIATNIATLTRIPVRVYQNNECIIYSGTSNLPKDPASLFIDKFLSIDPDISYYLTPFDQFYGIIKHDSFTFIIGPSFQMNPTREKIRDFMFQLGIQKNYMEQFQNFIASITSMPLELFLHELCLIYYFITEKKIALSDIIIYDSNASISAQNKVSKETLPPLPQNEVKDLSYTEHTTYAFEEKMLQFVEHGDLDGLLDYFKGHSFGRPGKVAHTYLRQIKNIFITSATLVSRAAIHGGLPAEEALSLSDRYIQHCEQHNNPEQVMNLQYNMVIDYTSLVAKFHDGDENDKFLRSVKRYIREHLLTDLSVDQMAKDLYMSRSYLSTKFKKETGGTLSSYIQEQQMERAKELLKTTDKSILEISAYLGFSSQGYFQNVFKKMTGMTPKEYRER